jgi:uncharacterized protein (DUF885 family)
VHALGLREVTRLRANLVGLQGALGIAGDPRAVFDAMRADPQFQFRNPQSMLDSYAGLRDRVDARMPALFLRRPKATFEIRPVEDSRPSYAMDALYLSEAVPGRHYQTALAQETPNLPQFRRFGDDAAFVAGWALYAESLGSELGLYADPYSQFGALNSELWHAAALVIDTALHSKDWSRQRASEYLRANTALGEADIAAEVDRYIAHPGQALTDKVGQLKILELRRRAEQQLGERFDLREFHEQIVGSGSLPLSVLETKVNRWIESRH